MQQFRPKIVVAAALLLSASVAMADSERFDGLDTVDSHRLSQVHLATDVDFGAYQKVMLEPAVVEFERGWRNRQRRAGVLITSSTLEELKQGLATQVEAVFGDHVVAQGYERVDAPGEGVLRVTPRLVGVNIYFPDAGFNRYRNTRSGVWGYMTLDIDFSDAATGRVLASVQDQKLDRSVSYTTRNSVSDSEAVRQMLTRWADALSEELTGDRQPVDGDAPLRVAGTPVNPGSLNGF